jgi:hypothetical protein
MKRVFAGVGQNTSVPMQRHSVSVETLRLLRRLRTLDASKGGLQRVAVGGNAQRCVKVHFV